jgi:hypothetical protein
MLSEKLNKESVKRDEEMSLMSASRKSCRLLGVAAGVKMSRVHWSGAS